MVNLWIEIGDALVNTAHIKRAYVRHLSSERDAVMFDIGYNEMEEMDQTRGDFIAIVGTADECTAYLKQLTDWMKYKGASVWRFDKG